eukprot:TRINITY_DN43168_c1_g1_i3.p1 TRINITY_DN43168_c1_g1~~TRINITY_DN43168_c1_g1_i3.p1  ORF type:complete len:479 (-),score=71.27 TRINITY_DN43168_c1_g1_i3:251-1663(-)
MSLLPTGLPFSYPLLPLNILAEELQSLLGIRVAINELGKPNSERVIGVYERFLQDLNEQAYQKLYNISEDAKSLLEYPEIYGESLRLFKLQAALRQVVRIAGVSDLGLRDLAQPEARRFQQHLSALINYKKFRDDKLSKFNEYQQQIDTLTNSYQQLSDENLQFTGELKRYQTKRKQEEQEAQQVMCEVSELDNRRKVAHDQYQKIQQETKNAKAVYGQKRNEVASLKLELQSAEQISQSLKDQLVDSPEQLQQNLKEVTESIEMERSGVNTADVKLRDCRNLCDEVKKMCGDVDNAILGAERVKDAIQEKKTLSRGFKADQQQMQELERAIKLQELNEGHLRKQVEMSQERLNRYTAEKQSKQDGYEKALAEQREQKQQLQQEIIANEQKQVTENSQKIDSLKNEMNQKQLSHDEAMQALKDKEQKIYGNISNKIQVLGRAMEKRIRNASNQMNQETENTMNLSNIGNY